MKEETKEKLVGEGVNFERIRRITGYLVGTVDRFNNGNNTLYEINNRLNSLETKVKVLEQRLANNNSYQDDGSMYML